MYSMCEDWMIVGKRGTTWDKGLVVYAGNQTTNPQC